MDVWAYWCVYAHACVDACMGNALCVYMSYMRISSADLVLWDMMVIGACAYGCADMSLGCIRVLHFIVLLVVF